MKETGIMVLVILLLSACSTTTSTAVRMNGVDGLTYYMPKKDFIVTVTMAGEGTELHVSDVVLEATSAYADRSQQYVLQHNLNLLSDSKLDVTVDPSGLLKTTNSTTTTQVQATLEGIAASAGYGSFAPNPDDRSLTDNCTKAGVYVFLFDPLNLFPEGKHLEKDAKCGLTIEFIKLDKGKTKGKELNKNKNEKHSGVFYRQEMPYKLRAFTSDGTINKEKIIFSPSESKTMFLPLSRSFFATSNATLTFEHGIPVGYIQDDKSELVGAVSIPAQVIDAYFAAAGKLFSAFSTKNTNETALIEQETSLALAKHNTQKELELAKLEADNKYKLRELKIQACTAAINGNNPELVKALECGK